MRDIPLTPGLRLGRFELVHRLGRGGMGEVWEAVLHGPQGFRKPVALKVLRGGPQDEVAAVRLAREARLGALLNHPNVVGTYDLGLTGGVWTIAMELVRGTSLPMLTRAGGLSSHAVLDVGLQSCTGLAHIHALELPAGVRGLVHRDIKPSNLLVDRTGLIKIADLGVARLMGRPGEIAGTPGYMAPEQIDGTEDFRADLFALGSTLFALVVGHSPFGRGKAAMMRIGRVDEHLEDPDFLRPLDDLLPGLAGVVGRCLCHDPARRWADALDLRRALEALRLAASGPALGALLDRAMPGIRVDPPSQSVESSPSSDATVLLSNRGNVTLPPDPFFGRDQELGDVVAQIRSGARLITLLGLGGMGKTRLSLQAARQVGGDLHGGAWFVDLSEARTLQALCSAVVNALSLRLGDDNGVDAIGAALATLGRSVLILDNLEQVVGAASAAVARWIQLAPDLTLLCTSRIALRVREEHRIALGPLPADQASLLFTDRMPRPLHPGEAETVLATVRALDGMPLAIELAAARTRVLSVSDILDRMHHRLRLLAGGARDRPVRHRSVRASLDGSWELLKPWEQAAMGQLTVFEGGWSLEAAEAVLDFDPAHDAPWTLDVLEALADASLIRCDRATSRFRMPVVVQDYASGTLGVSEERAARLRHARHMATHGSEAALNTPMRSGDSRLVARLVDDADNIVAACRWAIGERQATLAVRCYLAAGLIYELRGPPSTSAALAAEVLTLDEMQPLDRVLVRHSAGQALDRAGRKDEALAHMRAALKGARAQGHTQHQSLISTNLAMALPGEAGTEALSLFRDARRLAQQIGDRRLAAIAADILGTTLMQQGRTQEGLESQEWAVAMFRKVAHQRSLAVSLSNLAQSRYATGDLDGAWELWNEAIPIHRAVHNRRSEALAIGGQASVAKARGALHEAGRLHEEAAQLARAMRNGLLEAVHLAGVGHVRLLLGDLDGARRKLMAAHRAHGDSPHAEVDAALGQLCKAEGDQAGALAACTTPDPKQLRVYPKILVSHGEIQLWAGQTERAMHILLQAGDAAEASGQFDMAALARGWRAVSAARDGNLSAALTLIAKANHDMDRGPAVTHHGTLACLAAEVAHRAGDAALARERLGAARSWADHLGAGRDAPLVQHITRVQRLVQDDSGENLANPDPR